MQCAFVFPGQGSQHVGMLADMAAEYPVIKATFEAASAVLGYDLWDVVSHDPHEQLNQTQYTQPALLTVGVASYRAWQSQKGAEPQVMSGHSLGEYTALVCAGALGFEEAVALVAERARLMQAAVPVGVGGMAAIIGLTPEQIDAVCQEASNDESVTPANFNSPQQTVLAGHLAAVERAITLAKAEGAKIAKKLPMSVPSHCLLMKPAAQELAVYLQDVTVTTPQIPVIHNVDALSHTSSDAIKQALVAQLYSPVRWVDCLNAMGSQGITMLIEAAPGKVLTGLSKRFLRDVDSIALNDLHAFQTTLQTLGVAHANG